MPSDADSGDTGEPRIARPSRGSGAGADPFGPAEIARRELMMTQTPEGSRWRQRAVWFVLAALVGAMSAVILASVH